MENETNSLYSAQILQLEDSEQIIVLEQKKLTETISNEAERTIAQWHAPWRQESLNFYLPLGWSFGVQDNQNQKMVGYFLAQPLLFFEGDTQTLWVEHVTFASVQVRDLLCEIAYKLAREKHFQKVLFKNGAQVANAIKPFGAKEWSLQALHLKTTK